MKLKSQKKKIKDMRQSEIKFKKGEDGIKLTECKIKEYGQNDDKFENKIISGVKRWNMKHRPRFSTPPSGPGKR